MANWNTTPKWTDFNDINGGEQFSRKLMAEDLNALAENIAYLYAHQGENEYLGDYANGNYRVGAIVKYTDGNIYICIKDTDDEQEPTNATYWEMLNEKGSGGTDSALPIEVSSEMEMNALLSSGTVGGVYKYTGTSGTYENGALYVLENNLITFTIDGTSYQAEEGMTWDEWLNSEYNTSSYYTTASWIRKSNSNIVGLSVGNPVFAWNNISANTAYVIITTSGLGPEPA